MKNTALLSSLSLFLYRVTIFLLLPLLLLFLVIRSKKQPAYRQRILERLGWLSSSIKPSGLLIHAASVGEVIAIRPLVERLLVQYPNEVITVTTFTPTGSAQVTRFFQHEIAQGRLQHCYLPIDHVVCTWLFLRRIKPSVAIFMETELWPNLVSQCANQGCELLLINGRLTEKSVTHYARFRYLFGTALQHFSMILCQSEQQKQRFNTLIVDQQKLQVSGNIKYDIELTPSLREKLDNLKAFAPSGAFKWLVASSHQPEESLILAAFEKIKTVLPHCVLMLVPRHIERFDEVATLFQQKGFTVNKRTDNKAVNTHDDVWLFNTLGELSAAYGLADVVTVAGSFCEVGGHNPLEAALFEKAIIVGTEMQNFSDVMTQFLQHNGIVQLLENTPQALANEVIELQNSPKTCQQLGHQAFKVVKKNQGALDKTMLHIGVLKTKSRC